MTAHGKGGERRDTILCMKMCGSDLEEAAFHAKMELISRGEYIRRAIKFYNKRSVDLPPSDLQIQMYKSLSETMKKHGLRKEGE